MPPVLFINLKRYFYDYVKNREIKLNDRFEFYEELDFDIGGRKYFTKESPADVRNVYRLHSVFIHSGIMYAGHYYAYI